MTRCRVIYRLSCRAVRKKATPISVMIGLTYRCQCQCVHCCSAGNPVRKEDELTTAEIRRVIQEAKDIGVLKVRFFGGEPLLREDIFELVRYAAEAGLITSMDTNGELLSRETAQQLRAAGMCEIDISLDSDEEHIHDSLRNRGGSYGYALKAIRHCQDAGISCIISTYARKQEVYNGYLKRIIAIARILRVDGVKILFPVSTGKWLDMPSVCLSAKEKSYVQALIDSSFVFFEGQGNFNCETCSMIKKEIFYISAYGQVWPCCFVPISFGNIRQQKLSEILRRMWQSNVYAKEYTVCPMNNQRFKNTYADSFLRDRYENSLC